jgi:hypothetical protein
LNGTHQLFASLLMMLISAIFLKKIGFGMHSDPQFHQRGDVSNQCQGKKVPESHSSLRPEKEILEWHSGTFHPYVNIMGKHRYTEKTQKLY